jgi:glycosyltransferase involved in cell wall biosynthesis
VVGDLEELEYTTFVGFSSAALEALNKARRQGALAIVDEIAPTHLEEEILAEERKAFPGWEPGGEPIDPAFLDRVEEEWAAADRVMVNSEWTRRALLARAVPETKIHVVPISYTLPLAERAPKRWQQGEELRVLWLGTLCLRKGLPYAIQAARRLQALPVRFTFAGPSDIDLSKVKWPSNADYLGQIPRPEIGKLWDRHHVFLLPTLSDGFAITQIEAIAHGLPVIATPCCGDVVEDGRCGQIVAPRDSRAIAEAIERILDGAFDFDESSLCALRRARAFTPKAVWPKLQRTLLPAGPAGS